MRAAQYLMATLSCLALLAALPLVLGAQPKTPKKDEKKDDKKDAAKVAKSSNIKLPGTAIDVKPALNGDLLVVRMLNEKLLAVVDLKQKKLARTIKATSADFMYAAGGNRVVIFDSGQSMFQVFDLTTGERVLAKMAPFTGYLCQISMGSGNDKWALMRVAVGTGALDAVSYYSLDVENFTTTELKTKPRNSSYRDQEQLRLSPDGKYFCAWQLYVSPMGIIFGTFDGNDVTFSHEHDTAGYILPLPGTQLAVTQNGRVINGKCSTVKQQPSVALLPDVSSVFYYGVSNGDYASSGKESGGKVKMNVFATSSHQVLGSIELPLTMPDFRNEHYQYVHCNSSLKVVAGLSDAANEVVVCTVDPFDLLAKSGQNYLVLTSTPPANYVPGSKYSYEVKCITNSKIASIEIMDGPDGAKVEGNVINWDVPAGLTTKTEFLLKITSAKKDEVFQTFAVSKQP